MKYLKLFEDYNEPELKNPNTEIIPNPKTQESLLKELAKGETNLELLQSLLQEDTVNITKEFTNQIPPLNIVAHYNERNPIETTELLIHFGADVNDSDEKENTPLHLASNKGNVELCEYLINQGVDIYKENKLGKTPFELAFNDDVRKVLLNNMTCDKVKKLFISVCLHVDFKPELIKTIYKMSDCINLDDKVTEEEDYTMLQVLIYKHKNNAAEFLIRLGADVNRKNKWGETPLMTACYRENVKIADDITARMVISENIKGINAKDKTGYSPLYIACMKNNIKLVKLLLKPYLKANVNTIATSTKETPLHVAVNKDNIEITKLLLQKGANVNLIPTGGLTVTEMVKSKEMNELLKEYGAYNSNSNIPVYSRKPF